jgi:hypothetical protein
MPDSRSVNVAVAKLKKNLSHKSVGVAIVPTVHEPLESRSTLAEHIHRIGILGKRIDAHIQFMSNLDEHTGLSAEMKSRAAIAFHEELIAVEQQLARIHDEYLLE